MLIQKEHINEVRLPCIFSEAKSKSYHTIMINPATAVKMPVIIPVDNCLFNTSLSMNKVKMGAKVARKVAFAIVVSFIAVKKKRKCNPRKKPDNNVSHRFLNDNPSLVDFIL